MKPSQLIHFFSESRICLLSLLLLLSLNYKAQFNIINWSESYRLKYDDFIGAVPGDQLEHKAVTFSVIEIKFQPVGGVFEPAGEIVNVSVFSYFKKELSWMRPDSKNDYTLRHEQGHFDITEIYARKIRKALSGLTVSRKNGNKKVNKICAKLIKQHHAAQKKYDKATSFSIREKNQKKWTGKIAEELKKLDAYKNPLVSFKLK